MGRWCRQRLLGGDPGCSGGSAVVEYGLLLALVVAGMALLLLKVAAALDSKLQALIVSLGLGS